MAITFMDVARESLRPLRQALSFPRSASADTRFAEMVRAVEARRNDGIGNPIPDIRAAIGRRFDFQI